MALERKFLRENGVPEENLDAIMAEYGKDIAAHTAEITAKDALIATKTTEITGLTGQISQRDTDIAALQASIGGNDNLSEKIAALQLKYDTDTTALKESISAQERDHAAEKLFGGYKFSSKAARNAAMSDFLKKDFKLEEGAFLGADSFFAVLKESDPGAFAAEAQQGDDEGGEYHAEKKPSFVRPTGGANPGDDKKNPFVMSGFNMVRQPPNADKKT